VQVEPWPDPDSAATHLQRNPERNLKKLQKML
jgi:hypothetical protein